jgi:hypothetical protein
MKDPLLQEENPLKVYINQKDLKTKINTELVLGINKADIIFLIKIYDIFFKKNKTKKSAENIFWGAIFAINSSKENPAWQEHCSSSLRELTIYSSKGSPPKIAQNYKKVNQNFPSKDSYYSIIIDYYDFFSGIVHQDKENIDNKLRKIDEIEETTNGIIKESHYIQIVKNFLEIKLEFLKKYTQNEST